MSKVCQIALAGTLALCLPGAGVPVPAREPASVRALLRDAGRALHLTDEGLEGPGETWLVSEAASTQFLFIGEEHDTREIPAILTALWPSLTSVGYAHVATEVGGWLGAQLDRYARLGDRQALERFRHAALPRRAGISVPPVSEEDIAFYQALGRSARPSHSAATPLIWGLDHEFKAAPLLRRWGEVATDDAWRDRLLALGHRIARDEDAGRYDLRPHAAAIRALIEDTRAGSVAAAEAVLLREVLGRRVQRDGREQPRAQVFRQRFLHHYRAVQAAGVRAPRVLLRFGGYHARRGLMSDFGTSTLANFVGELASMEEASMLNVLFVSCSLTSTDDWRAPREHPRPCSPRERAWRAAFPDTASGWTLYDLRPLRNPIATETVDAGWELRELVMGFDAVVILGTTTRARVPPA